MSKKPITFDERELNVYRSFITVLYFLTLAALISIQLYRQFVLGQPSEQWDDIALLITANVLLLLGGGLFLSGRIDLQKFKPHYFIIGYAAFVLIGLLFTIFKYSVLLGQNVSLVQVWEYLLTILPITAILVVGWGLLAFLGRRRMEKQLE